MIVLLVLLLAVLILIIACWIRHRKSKNGGTDRTSTTTVTGTHQGPRLAVPQHGDITFSETGQIQHNDHANRSMRDSRGDTFRDPDLDCMGGSSYDNAYNCDPDYSNCNGNLLPYDDIASSLEFDGESYTADGEHGQKSTQDVTDSEEKYDNIVYSSDTEDMCSKSPKQTHPQTVRSGDVGNITCADPDLAAAVEGAIDDDNILSVDNDIYDLTGTVTYSVINHAPSIPKDTTGNDNDDDDVAAAAAVADNNIKDTDTATYDERL